MKRIATTIILSIGLTASAQFTITADDTTTIGDAITLYQVDSAAPSYDAITGAGATWDYTGYPAANNCFSTVDTVEDAQMTPAASYFPNSINADILYGNLSTYFTQDGSAKTSQGFSFYEPNLGDVAFNLDPNPVTLLTFPFSQGSSLTDAFSGNLRHSNILIDGAPVSGELTVDADGEGTLTFPAGQTVQALRLKYEEFDTVQVSGGIFLHRVTYYYFNLDSSNLPIFIHTTFEGSGAFPLPAESAVYSMYPACGVSIAENSLEELAIYPNPASDVINIDLGTSDQAEVNVYDVLGGTVLSGAVHGQGSLDVSSLPTGLYLVRVDNGTQTRTKRIFIK